MEKVFQFLSVFFILLATFFLWQGINDGLFISAVLGAVCFFINIRFQVGERQKQRQKAESE